MSDLEILIRASAATLLIQSLTDPDKLVMFRDHLIHKCGFSEREAEMGWIVDIIADEINERMPPRSGV